MLYRIVGIAVIVVVAGSALLAQGPGVGGCTNYGCIMLQFEEYWDTNPDTGLAEFACLEFDVPMGRMVRNRAGVQGGSTLGATGTVIVDYENGLDCSACTFALPNYFAIIANRGPTNTLQTTWPRTTCTFNP